MNCVCIYIFWTDLLDEYSRDAKWMVYFENLNAVFLELLEKCWDVIAVFQTDGSWELNSLKSMWVQKKIVLIAVNIPWYYDSDCLGLLCCAAQSLEAS